MVQKIYSKMHPVLCTDTHHDVTYLVNHGMVKNTKSWISREWNITFLWNKKILNLCLIWHILRSYHFVAEVTFKNNFRPYSNYGRDSVTFNKKGISSSLFPLAAGGLISFSSFHDSKKDYTLTIHTVHFVSALLSKLRREDILVF